MRQRSWRVRKLALDCPWASLSVAAIAAVAEPQPPAEQSAGATPGEGLWPGLAALKGYQATEWCACANKFRFAAAAARAWPKGPFRALAAVKRAQPSFT